MTVDGSGSTSQSLSMALLEVCTSRRHPFGEAKGSNRVLVRSPLPAMIPWIMPRWMVQMMGWARASSMKGQTVR